jgi:3-phenylpropionate/trans-cinnamate dioxygenase ferredoxin subunit
VSPLVDICPVEDLQPGEKRLVELADLEIGVFNCNGQMYAIEDLPAYVPVDTFPVVVADGVIRVEVD